MPEATTLVVGGGPTGLCLAIELHRLGVPVRLIDKASQPAQYSQALVIQARTLEQFERYGIADRFVANGNKIQEASVHSEGRKIVEFEFSRIPGKYPYLLFHPQSDTERLLIEHLESLGGSVERNTELIDFTNSNDGVIAKLKRPDGATEGKQFSWMIGCDGAHSFVREHSGIRFEGETVSLKFALGDLELEGPDVPEDALQVRLHHGEVLFVARLYGKTYRVIVVLHEDEKASFDNRNMEAEDFRQAFEKHHFRANILSASWMTPFHVNERRADQHRSKRVFLAGDACHIHSPVGGQGMNTGLQDVANLAWKLAAHINGAPERLLDSYDEERGAVGKALLDRTSRVLSAATNRNRLVEMVRDLVVSTVTQLEKVQEILGGFVSETAISYRDSSVVYQKNAHGSLHAGDRMPNLELASGKNLLAGLKDSRALTIGVGVADGFDLNKHVPRSNIVLLQQRDLDSAKSFGHDAPVARLFGKEASINIVRPDGYVGFRGKPDDRGAVNEYARLTGLA